MVLAKNSASADEMVLSRPVGRPAGKQPLESEGIGKISVTVSAAFPELQAGPGHWVHLTLGQRDGPSWARPEPGVDLLSASSFWKENFSKQSCHFAISKLSSGPLFCIYQSLRGLGLSRMCLPVKKHRSVPVRVFLSALSLNHHSVPL